MKSILSLCTLVLLSFSSFAQLNTNEVTYFEDFDAPGIPTNIPANSYWMYYNEIDPSQENWEDFIPGDGNAYITVDTDTSNDLDWIHPFQSLIFGGVGENHRLEVRMKGAVVDGGLVSFLFTYHQEGSIFNEVDLELVADDAATAPHPTLPENGGWTDGRFNTWRNANENSNVPFTGTKKAIVNAQNEKISLIDDEFHTYTIDWGANRIDFFIDGILQESLTTNVATGVSEVIIGFRDLPWAGSFNWSGKHTIVVDYLKIEPLEPTTVAENDSFTIDEDIETDFDVLANDVLNATIASFDALSVEGFPITQNGNLLTYSPSGRFSGTDSFTYTISDENGVQTTASVTVTVEPVERVNGVPFAKTDALTAIQNVTTSLNVLADNGYGADDFGTDGAFNDGLTFLNGMLISVSEQGSLVVNTNNTDNPLDDVIEYTPNNGFIGVDNFYYMISDTNGDASIAQVTVTVTESDSPTATADLVSIIQDSGVTSIDVLANDSYGSSGPAANPLTLATGLSTELGTIIVNEAKIDYTPATNFTGTDTFNYTIEDAGGITSTTTVTITVSAEGTSDVPTAKNDAVTVGQNSIDNEINILLDNGDGADNFGLDGPNTNHPISLASFYTNLGGKLELDGSVVKYTPTSGFLGTDVFSYIITDSNGDAASAEVTVTVLAAAPILTAVDDVKTVAKDSGLTSIDVLSNDSYGSEGPANSNALIINTPSIVNGATIVVNSDKIDYTPTVGFSGTDTFTYTIEDALGATETATVTVTVQDSVDEVADGVLEAKGDVFTVVQNSVGNEINVLADNGSGEDNFGSEGAFDDGLTFLDGTLSSSSEQGTISVDTKNTNSPTDDVIVYTPNTGFTGVDHFYYMITDANGASAIAQVAITVTETSTPSAVADVVSVIQDSGVTSIDVLENDSFGADGEGLTPLTLSSGTSTELGTILVNAGKIDYSPALGFTGTDTFNYTIEDAIGQTSTASVTINVGIVSTSNEPTAKDDAITVTQDSVDNIINILLDNGSGVDDYGADGPNVNHPISLTAFYTDNGGKLELDGSTVKYTPKSGFTGVDNFDYLITDTTGDASRATVVITVSQTPTVLEAVADAVSVEQDSGVNSIDVLSNDGFGLNLPISITVSGLSDEGGIIVVNADKVDYIPALNFLGTDTFDYTIEDAIGATSTATVTVTVEAEVSTGISIPTAKDDAITVTQNSIDNIINILLDNGSGADDFGLDGPNANHPISLSGTYTDLGGKLELDGNSVKYTPQTNFTGIDTFNYTLTDLNGDASTATVTVDVVAAKSSVFGNNNPIVDFRVFPNPSKGAFNVLISSNKAEEVSAILFDLTGKQVYTTKIHLKNGDNKIDFNVDVKPGILFLKVNSEKVNYGVTKIIFK